MTQCEHVRHWSVLLICASGVCVCALSLQLRRRRLRRLPQSKRGKRRRSGSGKRQLSESNVRVDSVLNVPAVALLALYLSAVVVEALSLALF